MGGNMRRVAIACFIAALGASLSAGAGTECVSYQVTAPLVGTRTGSRCVNAPASFDFPLSVHDCRNVPPAGVSECADVQLNLPLP
jgi:hypothetical protein